MFDLSGKRALVTGASGGIGAAIARALHAAGASVALSGTRREALDDLAAELGDRAKVFPCDLSSPADVEALVPVVETGLGDIDILVNNAGLAPDGLAIRMSDADWDAVLAVNLTAAFRLSRAALRGMIKRRAGRIVSITAVVAATGNPGQANYIASKAGLAGMTKSLAHEVASRGITVNCVAPGFIATAMTDALNEKQRATILEKIPARRLGTPAEIAAAVLFLASNEAAYVTGETIHVNGGMAMI
ncbi:MAG: 3-oxoacyl-[acyl-carrier-protein] reductase [Bauldia sp.]